jgi:ribonuclease P protein component
MLPHTNRLSKQEDFKGVFSQRKTKHSHRLVIKKKSNNLPFSRFSVIISARVIKGAVGRNRLRRQLNEILRLHLNRIKKSFDIILVVKSGLVDQKYNEIEKILVGLLKENKLYV